MKRAVWIVLVLGAVAVGMVACSRVARPTGIAETRDDSKPTPKVLPPDATITNRPGKTNEVVHDLPPLTAGMTRSIVDGDGSLGINDEGDLIRTSALLTTGIKQVKIREKVAGKAFEDRVLRIAVEPAPWELIAFPEMIVESYTQDSVAQPGPVKNIKAGGFKAMVKKKIEATAAPGAEPVKKANRNGIEFAANGPSHLTFRRESDALALYRWTLVIFRVDASTGSGKVASVLRVNDGPQFHGRSGNWMPRIDFNKTDSSVSVYYRGTKKHRLKSPTNSAAGDGRWNVVLTYRRHGRLFLRVNGKDCGQRSPTNSFSTEKPEDIIASRIGGKKPNEPMWALDGLWIGQSELTERVVEKMEAWALVRADGLPGGSAAKPAFKPVIDAEDFPTRYTFNADRWTAWKRANPKTKRHAFQGKPVKEVQPDRSDWVCIFRDDFRKPAAVGARSMNGSSVGDSTYDMDAGKQIWYAPGHNCAVGGRAIPKDGNDRPFKKVYAHDPNSKTMTMRLYCAKPAKGKQRSWWHNSQFSSVNEAGVGYSWAGVKGFRVRAKLRNIGPGLFPAPLWFYNLESLMWRTGERVEFDIIELDDDWDNYGASHVHCGKYKGLFGHSSYDTMKKKSMPPELRNQLKSPKWAAGKAVCGINAWDGKYHTWEVWIEDDLTYINIDGVEVTRVTTTPEYLQRLYMYVDTCLKSEKGMNEKLSYDMIVDYIEAFQPKTVVDATPSAPFTARPTITGTATVGSVLTCNANVKDCDDVWYYWHSNGYPRGFGPSNTYKLLPGDKGCEIRCMVKAVGAINQPVAWTAPTPVE